MTMMQRRENAANMGFQAGYAGLDTLPENERRFVSVPLWCKRLRRRRGLEPLAGIWEPILDTKEEREAYQRGWDRGFRESPLSRE